MKRHDLRNIADILASIPRPERNLAPGGRIASKCPYEDGETGLVFRGGGVYAQAVERQDARHVYCDECGGSRHRIVPLYSHVYGSEYDDPMKYTQVRPCAGHRPSKVALLYNSARIPSNLALADLASITPRGGQEKTINDAKALLAAVGSCNGVAPQGRVWQGGVGTGKSHLMAAFAKRLILDFGMSARWVVLEDLAQDVRHTYRDSQGESEREIMDSIVTAKILLLDDIGRGASYDKGGHPAKLLDAILHRREHLHASTMTFATTNLAMHEIGEWCGRRAWSRLSALCEPHRMSSDDQRIRRGAA